MNPPAVLTRFTRGQVAKSVGQADEADHVRRRSTAVDTDSRDRAGGQRG